MKTYRTVAQRRTLASHRMTPSFSTFSLRSGPEFSLDPLLNIDEFVMSEPTFPPHPHAGFSAVTYLFEDSQGAFTNRDSLGDRTRIEPGALHWTQAASGMMHEEVPERPGVPSHGLQMFVNLRDDHKRAPPAAYHVSAAEMPEVHPTDGARVRVLAGTFHGMTAPLVGLLTPVTLLDVHLAPGVPLEVEVAPTDNVFAMIIRGDGAVAEDSVSDHEAVLLTLGGDRVRIAGGPRGLQLLFAAGSPIGEPVVFGGPFAMTREEDLQDARRRFGRGEMGSLAPSFPTDSSARAGKSRS